jgi:hypothetical protein
MDRAWRHQSRNSCCKLIQRNRWRSALREVCTYVFVSSLYRPLVGLRNCPRGHCGVAAGAANNLGLILKHNAGCRKNLKRLHRQHLWQVIAPTNLSHRQLGSELRQQQSPIRGITTEGGAMAHPTSPPPGSDVGLVTRGRRRIARVCCPIGKRAIHPSRIQGGMNILPSYSVLLLKPGDSRPVPTYVCCCWQGMHSLITDR